MKAKPNTCLNCDRIILGSRFCPYCGGNQADLAAFFASVQVPVAPKVEAKPAVETARPATATQTPTKPKSNKMLILGLGAAAVVIALAAIGGQDSSTVSSSPTSSTSNSSTDSSAEPEPTVVTFADAATEPVIADQAAQTCQALGEIVVPDNNPSFLPDKGAVVIDEVARIERESTAKNYVSDNRSWINDDFLEGYRDSLREAVQPQLDIAIAELGYSSSEYELDQGQWSTGFLNLAIESCGFSADREATEDAISAFQDDVNRVIRLSK